MLLPAENYTDWSAPLASVQFAQTLKSAWNRVCGKGTKDGESCGWPEAEDIELHQLVGGSPGVNIALPLCFPVGKVVLWISHSTADSQEPAKLIQEVVSELAGVEVVTMDPISHLSLVEAESSLREALKPLLDAHRTVIFNVTSGNRLMSYAVQAIARSYPNLWLVYKERDKEDAFVRIVYEGDYPVTSFLSLPKTPSSAKAPSAKAALDYRNNGQAVEGWKNLVTCEKKSESPD
jgi:hypothetical protein